MRTGPQTNQNEKGRCITDTAAWSEVRPVSQLISDVQITWFSTFSSPVVQGTCCA